MAAKPRQEYPSEAEKVPVLAAKPTARCRFDPPVFPPRRASALALLAFQSPVKRRRGPICAASPAGPYPTAVEAARLASPDYAGAAAAASELIKLEPFDASGYNLRAVAFDRGGSPKEAISRVIRERCRWAPWNELFVALQGLNRCQVGADRQSRCKMNELGQPGRRVCERQRPAALPALSASVTKSCRQLACPLARVLRARRTPEGRQARECALQFARFEHRFVTSSGAVAFRYPSGSARSNFAAPGYRSEPLFRPRGPLCACGRQCRRRRRQDRGDQAVWSRPQQRPRGGGPGGGAGRPQRADHEGGAVDGDRPGFVAVRLCC